MELAAETEPFISPLSPFIDKNTVAMVVDAQKRHDAIRTNDFGTEWSQSSLNPCNRVDGSYEVKSAFWRMDGCAGQGRRFFATPVGMSPQIPVRRIDVVIPPQSEYPNALRRSLEVGEAFNLSGNALNRLGIARYILHVLELWSQRQPYFREIYGSLPFGSMIVVENIAYRLPEVRLRWMPDYEFSRSLLSVTSLQQLWQFSDGSWPRTVGLSELCIIRQLQDSISVVQMPRYHGTKTFVFKSSTHRLNYIYHELKLLLSMPPHPHVIRKPHYVIVDDGLDGEEPGVLGFVLEHYGSGSLADALQSQQTISLASQLRWSQQILQTCRSILDGPAGFYSELKPDNLLISGLSEDIIFIDFEQSGNWDTFAAPEILYASRLQGLASSVLVPADVRVRYADLLRRSELGFTDRDALYNNPDHGYYEPWIILTKVQREAAMMYAFGKVLWCIFEGCCHTKNSTDEKYSSKAGIEFPHFRKTPQIIQNLVQACTASFTDTELLERDIMRDGSFFYPVSDPMASPAATIDAAQSAWMKRNYRMEEYMEAKIRWNEGERGSADAKLLGFPQRCTLEDGLSILERAAEELSYVI